MIHPENCSVRRDRFEALSVEMVGHLACELVESIEVTVEVIATVVRADETAQSTVLLSLLLFNLSPPFSQLLVRGHSPFAARF